jgi:hypothetical protein
LSFATTASRSAELPTPGSFSAPSAAIRMVNCRILGMWQITTCFVRKMSVPLPREDLQTNVSECLTSRELSKLNGSMRCKEEGGFFCERFVQCSMFTICIRFWSRQFSWSSFSSS